MKKLLINIVVACLSTIILSVGLALRGDVEFFVAYVIIAAPVMLIGGVPFSMLADWLLERLPWGRWARYGLGLLAYAVGGVLVMLLFLVVIMGNLIDIDNDRTTWVFFTIGVIGALIYQHVGLLLRWIWSTQERASKRITEGE